MESSREISCPSILMPEIVLYNTIKSIFNIVKDDFKEQQNEKDSILYHFFKGDDNREELQLESFNYYEQAKDLFLRNNSVNVSIGYNMEVASLASVHIMLPSESGRPLGLGADENYIGYAEQTRENIEQAILTEVFDANYNLIITSVNTLEVLLIYNFLKASFVSLYSHIELSGLRLPKLSGQDIQLQPDLVPPNIFHRGLGISFVYEMHVPDIMRKRLIKNFKITGINLTKDSKHVDRRFHKKI